MQQKITKLLFFLFLALSMQQVNAQNAYNLITNGDFRYLSQGWSVQPGLVAGAVRPTGLFGTDGLEFSSSISTTRVQYFEQEINFPVKTGDTLVFNFQYKFSGTANGGATATVLGYDAPATSGAWPYSWIANSQTHFFAPVTGSNWASGQKIYVVNNQYKKILVQFSIYFSAGMVGTFNIDNVSLEYRPKPITTTTTGGGNVTSSQWANASTTRINYNNQVAIGGNKFYNDTAYKLSVNGRLAAEEILVMLRSDWPDYVFKTGYRLLSLAQVEAYIQQHKHLPGIPSAAEIAQKGGIEIGEMNRKLVEKIEELTLYIIQQQKRIEALEKKQAGQ
jgi:hypothetical protein